MKITLYKDTLEQAILDDCNLTDDDKEMVEDKMSDYIQFLVDDLKVAGNQVSVENEARSPGPVSHAEFDDGQPTFIDIVSFWDWWN